MLFLPVLEVLHGQVKFPKFQAMEQNKDGLSWKCFPLMLTPIHLYDSKVLFGSLASFHSFPGAGSVVKGRTNPLFDRQNPLCSRQHPLFDRQNPLCRETLISASFAELSEIP